MKKAIDNYALGKQIESVAWAGESIPAASKRFVCPICGEYVALDIRGHFRHKNRTPVSQECERRVDGASISVYEKIGVPMHLLRNSDKHYTLAVSFAPIPKELLIGAEKNRAKLTIKGAFGQRYVELKISTERFSHEATTYVPINYPPDDTTRYSVCYENAPHKIQQKWSDKTEPFVNGMFFRDQGDCNRKICRGGNIATDTEYLFVGRGTSLRLFAGVSLEYLGTLELGSRKIDVSKFIFRSNQATERQFKSLFLYLQDNYKINLLLSESYLQPIWPPCCEDESTLVYGQSYSKAYLAVVSSNEKPKVYRYVNKTYLEVPVFEDGELKHIRMPQKEEVPLSVDKAFNGNVQFLSIRSICVVDYKEYVDLVDESGNSILNSALTRLTDKTVIVKTNFWANVLVKKKGEAIRHFVVNDDSGVALADLDWDTQLTVSTSGWREVFSYTFKRKKASLNTRDEKMCSKLRLLGKPSIPITPRVLAAIRMLEAECPMTKRIVSKYLRCGMMPYGADKILLSNWRRCDE